MAKMGISNDFIKQCLNHKQSDCMTRVYVQDRREGEQAVTLDKLGSKLSQLTTGAIPDNVINFPAQKRQ